MMNDDLPIVAFPQTVGNEHCFGMMLRDYFAAKAMQSFVSDPLVTTAFGKGLVKPAQLCNRAYELADAMMEARK
jgi:hypothetical protein